MTTQTNEISTDMLLSDQTQRIIPTYKDTVFRMLFRDKKELLSLFNAVNDTHYDNPNELTINTLENAIYMNMKNDLSCVLDSQLNLYEHQSTDNPNMPLRNLFYVARIYERMAYNERIYSTHAVQLPAPKFVVFYNGESPQPERKLLYLSNLYSQMTEPPNLELIVIQLNINSGYNEELKRNCPSLFGYMKYVEKIREHKKQTSLETAIDQAVTECINEGVLADFFQKNRAEVIQMSIFEYDQENHMKMIREESWEDGRIFGEKKGQELISQLNQLTNFLIRDNRISDLQRSTEDKVFQHQLLIDYGLIEKK